MTERGFNRIEAALGVRLPDAYKSRLDPFPIPHEAGNADDHVWDDPDALIDLNRRVRDAFAVRPRSDWPPWLFVIGQAEGDPAGHAIDVRDPTCPVWWIERLDVGGLGPSDGPTGESFEAWCTRWIGEAPCPPSVPNPIAVFVVWGLICAVAVLAVAAYHAWSARPA
ncbi:SMI1/KNR4 family protein [Paludisphaera soli]|uniref:SMI1/KNR4 family protein n=1 Tax=Paludisphaera soli TaxID=2712865 RepID=UPI0013EC38B9|nr:SMI1/KNR4 family protein [Paludisphaera soli]